MSYNCSLDPLQKCAAFRYHYTLAALLFRVRSIPHTSSEGSQDSETGPFAPDVATVADSQRGIPVGMNLSGLDAPGVFLDSVSGYGVSAESAEPSCLVILTGSNPAPLHFIKEHPSAGPTLTPEVVLTSYLCSWLCASGGKTVVPRSNFILSAACRGYRLACSRFYSFRRCPLPRPLPKEQNRRARPH